MPLSRCSSPGPGPSHWNPEDIVPSGKVVSEAPVSIDLAQRLGSPTTRLNDKSRDQSHIRDVIWDGERSDAESNNSATSYSLRPWYRRPSPWWIIPAMALSALISTMTTAPRTEIYIRLICAELKPKHLLHPSSVLPVNATASTPMDIAPSFHGEPAIFLRDLYPVFDAAKHFKVPRPSAKCTSDPEIGALVAKLATTITFVNGFLSFITTGWWAKLSDKAGRTRVLGLGVLGLIVSDLNLITVTMHAHKLTGAYNFLILGSVADGEHSTWRMFTASAAAHAYVSDCADPGARAQMFSLYSGIVFVGMTLGPTLGGLLITATGDLLSVFYVHTIGHTIYAIVIYFFMPESLTLAAKASIAERQENAAVADAAKRERWVAANRSTLGIVFRNAFSFLTPLELFIPRKRVAEESGNGRDWNLTWLALAYFVHASLGGSGEYKIQYAAAAFHWTSEQLGYWLTAIGITSSLQLLIILPLIYRLLGPRRSPLRDPDVPSDSPTQPLLDAAPPTNPSASAGTSPHNLSLNPSHDQRMSRRQAHRVATFDLRVTKISAFINLLSYLLVCIVAGPLLFTASTCLAPLGVGFGPGLQSLAIALMPRGGEDAGKLFGALALISALSAQIIGPTFFGAAYIATVATFPKAIFLLSALLLLGTTGFLFFIRLPRHRLFP
ncbi:hypothetical protein BS47DRAFT_1286818 [Hydnum rufescens UP504]|uniref:MFS transporter n=1 Tax=Hydnum rufescens UP504 TaxID=1448309 RepID=A0A9P6E247_9AGAM|nr:hypothetical protein BS47DRAFT_1286818 [Hydnum rufescens UP504]